MKNWSGNKLTKKAVFSCTFASIFFSKSLYVHSCSSEPFKSKVSNNNFIFLYYHHYIFAYCFFFFIFCFDCYAIFYSWHKSTDFFGIVKVIHFCNDVRVNRGCSNSWRRHLQHAFFADQFFVASARARVTPAYNIICKIVQLLGNTVKIKHFWSKVWHRFRCSLIWTMTS